MHMCGIVGYIGKQVAIPILVNGLKKLEYRGYDSAGVAVVDREKIVVSKSLGKLAALEEELGEDYSQSCIGIGHTRWATHGRPSFVNAHPHIDCKQEFAVVHNGIIENYLELKESLVEKGHQFVSETDTEVLAHLVEDFYEGNLEEAVRKVIETIRGSYACLLYTSDAADEEDSVDL